MLDFTEELLKEIALELRKTFDSVVFVGGMPGVQPIPPKLAVFRNPIVFIRLVDAFLEVRRSIGYDNELLGAIPLDDPTIVLADEILKIWNSARDNSKHELRGWHVLNSKRGQ
jgi:hypothetical protein